MKKIFALMAIACIVGSCSSPQVSNNTSLENEKLVEQYFAYFNSHQWSNMAGMYAETASFKDPSLGKGTIQQTRKEIEKKYVELNSLFPDLQDKVVRTYPSGEKDIIVEFISSGTTPDGSRFELPICTIFTIEEGLIIKDFTYYDNVDEPKVN